MQGITSVLNNMTPSPVESWKGDLFDMPMLVETVRQSGDCIWVLDVASMQSETAWRVIMAALSSSSTGASEAGYSLPSLRSVTALSRNGAFSIRLSHESHPDSTSPNEGFLSAPRMDTREGSAWAWMHLGMRCTGRRTTRWEHSPYQRLAVTARDAGCPGGTGPQAAGSSRIARCGGSSQYE